MILVTGGAGFIGSNLVACLEQNGAEDIVICDQLGMEQKWRNISKRDLFDVISLENLNNFIEENSTRIATVFHLGAISTTTEKNADLIPKECKSIIVNDTYKSFALITNLFSTPKPFTLLSIHSFALDVGLPSIR